MSVAFPFAVLYLPNCSGIDLWVGLGIFNLSETDAQIIKMKRWVPHSGFDFDTAENDIALIELETAAVLSDDVQLVGLPAANADVAVGTDLLVSGWGTLESEYLAFLLAGKTSIATSTVVSIAIMHRHTPLAPPPPKKSLTEVMFVAVSLILLLLQPTVHCHGS